MGKNNEIIQTHPLMGWDTSAIDSCDVLMLRLHYRTPSKSEQEGTGVGQVLWLTTDITRQLIPVLEAGITKIEPGDFQVNEYRHHQHDMTIHPKGTSPVPLPLPGCIPALS